MKIVCDFCKTEYSIGRRSGAAVQCAVCGHIWTPPAPPRKNSLLVFIAAICALMAAVIFAVVIVTGSQSANVKKNPLVAQISEINTVVDAFGVQHFTVTGKILNRSQDIYGVPYLLIISYGEDGSILAQQKFMPAATLLDAGASVGFSHTLAAPTTGVKRVALELGG